MNARRFRQARQVFPFAAVLMAAACGPPPVGPVDAQSPDVFTPVGDAMDVPRDRPETPFDVPTPPTDTPLPPADVPPTPLTPGRLDLLVEIDNSGSMRENQANFIAQLGPMIQRLANPPDNNMDGRPDYQPVTDLHVGVISSDLGTPGSSVRGCDNADEGDGGLLNPIRYGQAMQRHLPWTTAPAGFRPADCSSTDQYPSFITFSSGSTDVAGFTHDFVCNAALYIGGCGLEQPLEAVWRAIVFHDASDRPGNTDPNAGFIREDALLAILLLTDEEDGSVRDCRYAESTGSDCAAGNPRGDALDVFNSSSSSWASANLNLRMYMYQPGQGQDPTWDLDRYVDPRNPTRGFLSVKPGHPERVIFAAITGVPLRIPMSSSTNINWDALLGAPDPSNRENFYGRNTMAALDNPTNAEGPISMRQANQDPSCADRVLPACRREGTMYNPMAPQCVSTEQYFAWPSRRIVEIARRFDQSPLCAGGPCRNGFVTSICSGNYAPAMQTIVERVAAAYR